jgi:hypothetical protein
VADRPAHLGGDLSNLVLYLLLNVRNLS